MYMYMLLYKTDQDISIHLFTFQLLYLHVFKTDIIIYSISLIMWTPFVMRWNKNLNQNRHRLSRFILECIAKWSLISQYVTTMLSKAVKQDDRSLVLKNLILIGQSRIWWKQTEAFFHTLADVNNLNTECYVIQSKKCKQK